MERCDHLLNLLCFLMQLVTCSGARTIDVTTNLGIITGIVEDATFNGTSKKVVNFLGIPYAEPPTGKLRFSKPVAKTILPSPFNATYLRSTCPQYRYLFPRANFSYSEDCLVLNMYVPRGTNGGIDVNANFPVMIWIHGGGFVWGTQNTFRGGTLSAFNDVIVVTINYRLSVFGFLNTNDSASPGNYGLWDQRMAIKWVHDNIEAFGGDVNRITLFGESAGSASVIYQALYPGNEGLFQRIIAQSGSPLSPWAYREYNDFQKRLLSELGRNVGCKFLEAQSRFFVDCLRRKSFAEIMNALKINPSRIELGFQFVPTLDGDFIKTSPENTFRLRNSYAVESIEFFRSFDFLTGVNDKEGGSSVPPFDKDLKARTGRGFEAGCPRWYFDQVVVPNVVLNKFYRNLSLVETAISLKYWSNPGPSDAIRTRCLFVDLNSDFFFFAPAIKTVNIHAAGNDASSSYLYLFAHRRSTDTFSPKWLRGANHAGEIFFVFGYWTGLEPAEISLMSNVMKAFTNFAKSGNPNVPVITEMSSVWPRYELRRQRCYVFTTDQMAPVLQERLAADRVYFWNNFIPDLLTMAQRTQTHIGYGAPGWRQTLTGYEAPGWRQTNIGYEAPGWRQAHIGYEAPRWRQTHIGYEAPRWRQTHIGYEAPGWRR